MTSIVAVNHEMSDDNCKRDIYEGWLEYKIGKPVSEITSFVDDNMEYARCECSDGTYLVTSEIVPAKEWAPSGVVRQLVEIKKVA